MAQRFACLIDIFVCSIDGEQDTYKIRLFSSQQGPFWFPRSFHFASTFPKQGQVIGRGILRPSSRQQWLVDQVNLVRAEPEINLTKMGLLIPAVGSSRHIAQQENSSSLRQVGDVVRAVVTFLVMVHPSCMHHGVHTALHLLCNHHHETSSVGLDGLQKYVLLYIGFEST